MTFDPLSAAFDLGKTAIEKIWPDPTKRSEQMRALEQLRQDGDIAKLNAHVQIMLSQSKINLADANSDNLFQYGWRPAIGWTGAISLFLMFVPKALVITMIWTYQNIIIIRNTLPGQMANLETTAFPDLGVTDVIGLLVSMLGVAAMRSYDKKNNTDTK
tara:strand:- start:1238 stop:1714 length:477 start_codon:yes stop_codon:yes gene_type:complete